MDLGYISHLPVLAAALARTRGPILECGAGWGSTPLLHYAASGRRVVTLDSDLEWLKTFAVGYSAPAVHEFVHVRAEASDVTSLIRAWEAMPQLKELWAVAFIDCAPGEARVPIIRAIKGRARFILAHDTEADEPPGGGNYGWRFLKGAFLYQSTMKRLRPWTTVYSDEEPFPMEACDS